MNIRDAIYKLKNEQYIYLDNNSFMINCHDGIIIAFNKSDAISVIDSVPDDIITCSIDLDNLIFEDEKDEKFGYRLSSVILLENPSINDIINSGIFPDIHNLKKISNEKPIMIKIAQWGGMGGQGGMGGFGEGIGAGSPMAGAVNFDNPIARVQFDKSLDLCRKEQNGWNQSLESKMQNAPLYGHQRNDKDWNLKNYRLTFLERKKERKKDFLKRMIDNRKRFDQMIDNNSVANIKASPIDPKVYTSMEEKLQNRRHQEDSTEKRKQHGPESQFTYFPHAPREVTAQTIVHNGLSSIFEDDKEMMQGKSAYPDFYTGRSRIRTFPWGMYGPTRDGQMLDINNDQKTSIRPTDLGEDNSLMWGGYWNNAPSNVDTGQINRDYLADGYATGENPGEIQKPIFTKDMLPNIIRQMQDHLGIQNKITTKGEDNDELTTEKKLKKLHHDTPTVGITPTNYDIQTLDDGYPWASKEFFKPRYRLDHANG